MMHDHWNIAAGNKAYKILSAPDQPTTLALAPCPQAT
jgi:hypothetical protein